MKNFREKFWLWVENWALQGSWLYRHVMNRKKYRAGIDFAKSSKSRIAIIFDESAKVDKNIEKFVCSAVDVKPNETVEMRGGVVVVKPQMNKARLRQNAKQLRHYKKIWRQTDRTMPWKEFRAEINQMNSFSGAFCEAQQMVRDREIERAGAFGRIYRSIGNRELAADVAKSIDGR